LFCSNPLFAVTKRYSSRQNQKAFQRSNYVGEETKMTSRIALITLIAAGLSASGLMAKQDTAVNRRQAERVTFLDHMSTALNLSSHQTQDAKAIFKSERETASAARRQLRDERHAVEMAIQSGRPIAEVKQLAKNEGPTLGDLAGMRAAAFDKFYAVLTPAQQQKLASLHNDWRQRHAATPAAEETK
jgi:Spy/CpxP family protein refolding chaperone